MAEGFRDGSNDEQNKKNRNKHLNIEDETKIIFEHYVSDSFEQDKRMNRIDPGTPGVKVDAVFSVNNEQCYQIGKKLLNLSEKFEVEETGLNSILRLINTENGYKEAFEEFSEVAERVLSNNISLSSILYLFRFGYRIARDRLLQGVVDFLGLLANWIIAIFKKFSVFDWIVSQGGWMSLVRPSGISRSTIAIVTSVILLCGGALVYYRYKKN